VTDEKDILGSSVREFAAAAAAKTPTPGGGSVAAVAGALGVALGEMALNFTMGKKKYAEHEAFYAHLSPRLAKARQMFEDLVADDISAYKLYQESTRMEDGADKDAAVQLATAAAINVPREAMKLGLAVLADLHAMIDKCNRWLITDLMAGGTLVLAAIRLSDYNVCVNLPGLAEKDAAAEIRAASVADLARAGELQKAIEDAGYAMLA